MMRFRATCATDAVGVVVDPLDPSPEYDAWMDAHRGDPSITIVPLADDPVDVEVPLPEGDST